MRGVNLKAKGARMLLCATHKHHGSRRLHQCRRVLDGAPEHDARFGVNGGRLDLRGAKNIDASRRIEPFEEVGARRSVSSHLEDLKRGGKPEFGAFFKHSVNKCVRTHENEGA